MLGSRKNYLLMFSIAFANSACDKTAALEGQSQGAIQVMAYPNQAAFPACGDSSKGLMAYSMEDSKFYICDGTAFTVAASNGSVPEKAEGGGSPAANMNLCPDPNAPELPSPASNSGMIMVNPPADVDACSVEGFVIGKEGEVKLKRAKTGELFLEDVPPGDQDVIFKAASAQTLPSGLMLTSSPKGKGKRLNKIDVQPGKIKVIATIEMDPLVSISGKVHLLNKANGADDAGVTVFIPGTSYTAMSGPDGSYEISGVPPGIHNLLFQKEGYARGKFEGINGNQNVLVDDANLILGGTGENGSAVIANGVQLPDGKFHTNTFDLELAISPSDEAVLMMISEDPSFKGARWKPVSSSYQISVRETSEKDAIATNPYLTLLYGIQQTSTLAPSVISKTLNVKFANANGLETSIFEVPVEIDLFADVPGQRYKMDFASSVQVVANGASHKVMAHLNNIKIPAFASQMSVRKVCGYGNCTDDWITPTSSFSVDLGELNYSLCGRTNLEVRFKDNNEKYVSITTPQITTAEHWDQYISKMPNLNCSEILTNTNSADAPVWPTPAPSSYYYGNTVDRLSVYTNGKLYALAERVETNGDKFYQVHAFTPTESGGTWEKLVATSDSTNGEPHVLPGTVLSASDVGLFLAQTDSSVNPATHKYWSLDIASNHWSLISNISPPSDMSNLNCSDDNGWGKLPVQFKAGKLTRLCRTSSDTNNNPSFSTSAFNSFASPLAQVAGGTQHTCAIVNDTGIDRVKCWGGMGTPGALSGDPNDTSYPYNVSKFIENITPLAVSAGKYHSCAIVDDAGTHKVKCWGMDSNGALGRSGGNSSVSAPAYVQIVDSTDLSGVSKLYTRGSLSCTLMSDKKVFCWGSTSEFGGTVSILNGTSNTNHAVEISAFSSLSNISSLALGARSICALLDDGTVKCVGGGLSSSENSAEDQSFANAQAIAAGDDFICAVQTNAVSSENEVSCKGTGFTSPIVLSASNLGGSQPTQVVAGLNFACALNAAGDVHCWRPSNPSYPNSEPYSAKGLGADPQMINDLSGVTSLHGGDAHACATVADSLKCFGRNDYWQLGTSPTSVTVQSILSGESVWAERNVFIDRNSPQVASNGGGCGNSPFQLASSFYAISGKAVIRFNEDITHGQSVGELQGVPSNTCFGVAVGSNGFYTGYWDSNTNESKNFIGYEGESGFVLKQLGQTGLSNGFLIVNNTVYDGSSTVNLNSGVSTKFELSSLLRNGDLNSSNSSLSPQFSALIPGYGWYIFNKLEINKLEMQYSPTGYQYNVIPETRRVKFLDEIVTENP